VPALPPSESSATHSTSSLRLEAGDLVEVGVYNVPELTTKARVSTNGEIYLPLIDYVHVAGLTAEEAEGLIQKRLSDGGFVKSPHVTLFVDQYASQGASVLGEVARPGVYPVPGQQRLFDLISIAGGFTEKAGRSVAITHRDQPDKPITVPLTRNVTDLAWGHHYRSQSRPDLRGGRCWKAERISHGQRPSDGFASDRFSGRRDPHGKSGRREDHPPRP
jgi:polysaccharide export outer membrane protein